MLYSADRQIFLEGLLCGRSCPVVRNTVGVGWGGERVLMELTDWWRWDWELGERQMIS